MAIPKMNEFNVKVECTNDFRVVAREEAIREGRRQINELVRLGYKKCQIWCSFYHEISGSYLGSLEYLGNDLVILKDCDPRIATLKAILN